jgi:hypothetical protein
MFLFAPRIAGSRRGLLHVAVISLGLLACRDAEPTNPDAESPVQATQSVRPAFVPGRHPITLDEELSSIADQVPGFGGMFRDYESGRVVVFIDDLSKSESARGVIAARLVRDAVAPSDLVFVKGTFDFRDLARWRSRIEQLVPTLVLISDVNEATNRIVLRAKDSNDVLTIQKLIGNLGFPQEAFSVEITAVPVRENLSGYARPVRGGIQVQVFPLAPCTLGFVAMREYGFVPDPAGPRYVVTASHCTPAMGVDQDATVGQPSSANVIGSEFSDPPFFGSAENSNCPDSIQICRWSDAAMFELTNNSDTLSAFNGVALANGLTLTGTAFYSGKQTALWSGMPVNKIGRVTGLTSGTVTNTCVNALSLAPVQRLLCSDACHLQ